jgi:hypothetical protein
VVATHGLQRSSQSAPGAAGAEQGQLPKQHVPMRSQPKPFLYSNWQPSEQSAVQLGGSVPVVVVVEEVLVVVVELVVVVVFRQSGHVGCGGPPQDEQDVTVSEQPLPSPQNCGAMHWQPAEQLAHVTDQVHELVLQV